MCQDSLPFEGWVICHCVSEPHLVCPLLEGRHPGCSHPSAVVNDAMTRQGQAGLAQFKEVSAALPKIKIKILFFVEGEILESRAQWEMKVF